MVYPPTLPPVRTDEDLSATVHAGDHNTITAALGDIITELGASPSGDFADLTARLESILTAAQIEEAYGRGRSVTEAQFGATGDGTTDDTAAIQAAIDFVSALGGGIVYLPEGTYIVTTLTGASRVVLAGAGMLTTTIKRKAAAVNNNPPLSFTGRNGFVVRDLTIDGNKPNQTVGANNLQINAGCSDWNLYRVGGINAKAASGYGAGLAVVDGANDTTVELSRIVGCRAVTNDGVGIYINKEWYLLVEDNLCKGNGGAGIQVANLVYPPVVDVQDFLTITRNHCHDNGTVGIQFHGFYTAGASDAVKTWGATLPPNRLVQVTDNHCARNAQYGLAFQGSGGNIAGNTASHNGNSSSNGGFLINAWASSITGNHAFDNYHYGMDAGGSVNCTITANTFHYNGLTSGQGPKDLNVGATVNCVVSANEIVQGGAVAGTAIYAAGTDGASDTDPFPVRGSGLQLLGNIISLPGIAGSVGIYVTRNFDRVVARNNFVHNATAANLAFVFSTANVEESGNIDSLNYALDTNVPSIASASALVIPDAGDKFYVSGTTGITTLRTYSNNVWNTKVRGVKITNPGSGYSQVSPPTVTFTGGGGAGAAGTAVVSRDGQVVDVLITNPGTGYTSAPTVGFSSGTAAGTALVGCNNAEGKIITLLFTGVLTVTDGGNLRLNGNLTTTALSTILVLRGAFGQWHEVSRCTY